MSHGDPLRLIANQLLALAAEIASLSDPQGAEKAPQLQIIAWQLQGFATALDGKIVVGPAKNERAKI